MHDQGLWDRISRHYFDGLEDVELPFHARLARDMGWSNSFALNAIDEYRRFIYLCCISEVLLTPSEEVDEVWHLHLVYTQNYWEEFCPKVLGRPLHHGPTKGGPEEAEKYMAAYKYALELYEYEFDELPPTAYWPPPEKRFGSIGSTRKVNTADYFMIRRKPLYTAISVISGVSLLYAFAGWDSVGSLGLGVVGVSVAGLLYSSPNFQVWIETGSSGDGGCGGCGGCGG